MPDAAALLIDATIAMHAQGVPLMQRVVPAGDAVRFWDRYPDGGMMSPSSGASAFYHIHAPDARDLGEHGHFHLFLPRHALPATSAPLADRPAAEGQGVAEAVHIAALSIAVSGLPMGWFTVNRWVTDEAMYPADAVLAALDRFDLTDAPGDRLVNQWLTAAVALARPELDHLLHARDRALPANASEDPSIEILSRLPFDLEAMINRGAV
ncbi:MAG: DUF6969 family protein [Sphingomonas sp.]